MKRRPSLVILTGAAALLTVVLLAAYLMSPVGKMRLALGDRSIHLLREAQTARAFRIDPNWVQNPRGPTIGAGSIPEQGVSFPGYRILASGRSLPASETAELRDALLDAEDYAGPQPACDFAPGLAFRLTGPGGTAEALVDTACGAFQIVARSSRGRLIHTAYGSLGHHAAPLAAVARTSLAGRYNGAE